MQKRLSIIVPVYNVEKYLAKCLDSVLDQDVPQDDYEVIVVIDGSPDGCKGIADRYAAEYPTCVKVIEQENQGLGGARNTGVRESVGKYLMFVDSDDFLQPNVLDKLLKRIENDGLDVLRFNYQNVDEAYNVINPYRDPKHFVDFGEDVCNGERFLNEKLGFACYAWQFVMDRNMLSADEHMFCKSIYFEDTEWTPRMLVRAKKVSSVPLLAYNYLLRKGSITQATDHKRRTKLYQDTLFVLQGLQKQAEEHKHITWYKRMMALMVLSLVGRLGKEPKTVGKEVLAGLKRLGVFPLSTEKALPKVKFKILLLNASPMLYIRYVAR